MDRKYLEILKKSWKCIKDWPWSRIRLILRAVLLVLAPLLTVLACQTISLQDVAIEVRIRPVRQASDDGCAGRVGKTP